MTAIGDETKAKCQIFITFNVHNTHRYSVLKHITARYLNLRHTYILLYIRHISEQMALKKIHTFSFI